MKKQKQFIYKDIEKCRFHVFTDNKDVWVKTEEEAMKKIELWKKEGYENLRIYTCEWESIEGIYEDLDCIFYEGGFPN